mmetsp:Transcript_28238/g.86272  ORF Transcript_28238/g.86272 Transcript_28238/m.86272 type:complete len:209 (+) Transcript_28238:1302-1928(+)
MAAHTSYIRCHATAAHQSSLRSASAALGPQPSSSRASASLCSTRIGRFSSKISRTRSPRSARPRIPPLTACSPSAPACSCYARRSASRSMMCSNVRQLPSSVRLLSSMSSGHLTTRTLRCSPNTESSLLTKGLNSFAWSTRLSASSRAHGTETKFLSTQHSTTSSTASSTAITALSARSMCLSTSRASQAALFTALTVRARCARCLST